MEAATQRLYKAIFKGDIASFHNLLSEDPLILEECTIETSGRFVQSPLHVVAKLGHLEMVQSLVNKDTSMCLARDQDGRTPIHVAATKGQVQVLKALYHVNRYAAQEKTNHGESILHLCVKHRQLGALKTLLELTNDDGNQLINLKDNNGDTILHLAVTTKQPQMVECLLEYPAIEKNATNRFEMTAVDIHRSQIRKGKADAEIETSLFRAKAKAAKDALDRQVENKWLEDQRSALMVVASLIATMAFQAGINPPGGVWQETKKDRDFYGNTTEGSILYAGGAVWSYYTTGIRFSSYSVVVVSNTIGLISSLSVIVILISGLPCKRSFFYILRITLWISVTTTAITYLNSVSFLTNSGTIPVWHATAISLIAWTGVMLVVFFLNFTRLIKKVIGWKRREEVKTYCKNWKPTWPKWPARNANDRTTGSDTLQIPK